MSRSTRRRGAFACALLGLCLAMPAQAALTLGGTRIVYEGGKRSVSINVANPSDRPFAVQAWVNTAADDQSTAVPFIASPPLFRLNPGKEQQVQINGLPNDLPTDRESLFYFNVQEIPQAERQASGNRLNVAIRTRIKFFHRPAAVKDDPMARLKELRWSWVNEGGQRVLQVDNPTPFHYSFADIELPGASSSVESTTMVEPFARQRYQAPPSARPPAQVRFTAINDYGSFHPAITLPIGSSD